MKPTLEQLEGRFLPSNLQTIRADLAWSVTQGSPETIVAVVDTGVDYTHPDLYLNIWINQGEIPASRRANLTDLEGDGLITFRDLNNPINQGVGKITDLNHNGYIDAGDLLQPMNPDGTGGWADGVDSNGNGFTDDLVGWDFVNNDNDPFDDYGHGTLMAGIINSVTPDSRIMAVKTLNNQGQGSNSVAEKGVSYAAAMGAAVMNASWGGDTFNQSLQDTVAASGGIFVAAAGNDALPYPDYPARFDLPNVVAIGTPDAYSNYGPEIDLIAPGTATSTYPRGQYATVSGTSVATAYASGVFALARSAYPDRSAVELVQQVKAAKQLDAARAVGIEEGARPEPPRIVNEEIPTVVVPPQNKRLKKLLRLSRNNPLLHALIWKRYRRWKEQWILAHS